MSERIIKRREYINHVHVFDTLSDGERGLINQDLGVVDVKGRYSSADNLKKAVKKQLPEAKNITLTEWLREPITYYMSVDTFIENAKIDESEPSSTEQMELI